MTTLRSHFLLLSLLVGLASIASLSADDLPQTTLFYTTVSGIGAGFATSHEHIVVRQLVPDSPAVKAGLKMGDVLETIDGQSIAGLKAVDVVKRVRGPEGSVVKLQIERGDPPRTLDFAIKRQLLRFRRPNSVERPAHP